jgi:hypothetical protein
MCSRMSAFEDAALMEPTLRLKLPSRLRLGGQPILIRSRHDRTAAGGRCACNEIGCRTQAAIAVVIMESRNSPEPFDPDEFLFFVSNQ